MTQYVVLLSSHSNITSSANTSSRFPIVTTPNQHNRDVSAATEWFTVTILISFIGGLLLFVLLLSAIQQKRRYTGTRLLIVHMMLLQLLMLGFTFPLLNTQSYLAVVDGFNVTSTPHRPLILCLPFLYIHVATMHSETWAALLLAINRFTATVTPHLYRRLVAQPTLTILMMLILWCVGLSFNAPAWFSVGMQYGLGSPLSDVFHSGHRWPFRRGDHCHRRLYPGWLDGFGVWVVADTVVVAGTRESGGCKHWTVKRGWWCGKCATAGLNGDAFAVVRVVCGVFPAGSAVGIIPAAFVVRHDVVGD